MRFSAPILRSARPEVPDELRSNIALFTYAVPRPGDSPQTGAPASFVSGSAEGLHAFARVALRHERAREACDAALRLAPPQGPVEASGHGPPFST